LLSDGGEDDHQLRGAQLRAGGHDCRAWPHHTLGRAAAVPAVDPRWAPGGHGGCARGQPRRPGRLRPPGVRQAGVCLRRLRQDPGRRGGRVAGPRRGEPRPGGRGRGRGRRAAPEVAGARRRGDLHIRGPAAGPPALGLGGDGGRHADRDQPGGHAGGRGDRRVRGRVGRVGHALRAHRLEVAARFCEDQELHRPERPRQRQDPRCLYPRWRTGLSPASTRSPSSLSIRGCLWHLAAVPPSSRAEGWKC
ncbi:unnamed protein product, partial [Prorocentrum cordatum]